MALTELLGCLLCGEESAIHAFANEGRRLDGQALQASQRLLMQIAREENGHQQLLFSVLLQLPVSPKLLSLRRAARHFFMSMTSVDPAQHFARIAALDACVSRIMATVLHHPGVLSRQPYILAVCAKIHRDEARHVAVSRRHALDLGLSPTLLQAETIHIQQQLVDLLIPVAESFTTLGMDPERLFKRLQGSRPHAH
jgi:hypothetical protein